MDSLARVRREPKQTLADHGGPLPGGSLYEELEGFLFDSPGCGRFLQTHVQREIAQLDALRTDLAARALQQAWEVSGINGCSSPKTSNDCAKVEELREVLVLAAEPTTEVDRVLTEAKPRLADLADAEVLAAAAAADEDAYAAADVQGCALAWHVDSCEGVERYLGREGKRRHEQELRAVLETARPKLALLADEQAYAAAEAPRCAKAADEEACEGVEAYLRRFGQGQHAAEAQKLADGARPKLKAMRAKREAKERAEAARREAQERAEAARREAQERAEAKRRAQEEARAAAAAAARAKARAWCDREGSKRAGEVYSDCRGDSDCIERHTYEYVRRCM